MKTLGIMVFGCGTRKFLHAGGCPTQLMFMATSRLPWHCSGAIPFLAQVYTFLLIRFYLCCYDWSLPPICIRSVESKLLNSERSMEHAHTMALKRRPELAQNPSAHWQRRANFSSSAAALRGEQLARAIKVGLPDPFSQQRWKKYTTRQGDGPRDDVHNRLIRRVVLCTISKLSRILAEGQGPDRRKGFGHARL